MPLVQLGDLGLDATLVCPNCGVSVGFKGEDLSAVGAALDKLKALADRSKKG